MEPCPACQKRALASAEERDLGICEACHQAYLYDLEPADFPASRRPALPCERCGHEEILRCLVDERSGEFNKRHPFCLSVERQFMNGFFGRSIGEGAKLGRFEAYVCRSCGFVEWYVLEPERVPIGRIFGTELVRAAKKPYR